MSRHVDWCACVCLIGGGQEINSGEEGVFGWGEALRRLSQSRRREWTVYAPPDVLRGGSSVASFTLGDLDPELPVHIEQELQLIVTQRSFRSPSVSRWVDSVLSGDVEGAQSAAHGLREYPVVITRSLEQAKSWLKQHGRGERRYGLVASSGARRLRANGLGSTLNATSGDEIAHWYLNPPGDIRSSFALEVPANEYTCQGLELDFVCLCWGGDLLWSDVSQTWTFFRLSGASWNRVQNKGAQRFTLNSYRVLFTRAREGLILWVPAGDEADSTRMPEPLDATADFLLRCGAVEFKGAR